jgi:hypothetical protein
VEPLYGGCLCGGVRFRMTMPFRRANHCHCSRCRKHSGTFGLTQGRVPREGFELLQGEELIRVYRPDQGAAYGADHQDARALPVHPSESTGREASEETSPQRGAAVKAFCSVCGSSLFGAWWPEGDEISIRLGAIDGDPGIRPQYRSFVGSKAAWDELPDDGLERYEAANPDA